MAPNEGPKRITDIPIDAVGGKSRIYGYEKSVKLNQLRRNPVVITQGSPTTRADPITILAKGNAGYYSDFFASHRNMLTLLLRSVVPPD